jgi:hypothetical protein
MRHIGFLRHALTAAVLATALQLFAGNAAAQVNTVELAAGDDAPMVQIQVTSSCDGDLAVFSLYNAGTAWPAVGTLGVYHVTAEGVQAITTRRMRLIEGQKASFRIRQADAGHVGFYVNPSWYQRTPAWDAVASCQ